MTNRKLLANILVFFLLVVLGVSTRWLSEASYPKLPTAGASEPSSITSIGLANFTAVTAAGLFAGFYFVPRFVACLVPLAIVVVSNLGLPKYNNRWEMSLAIAMLVLPIALGWVLQRRSSWLRVFGFAAAPAILFYLVTDFVLWPGNELYPHTVAGQLDSYIAALPFLRNMLLGDLFFTGLIFGIYRWFASREAVLQHDPQLAPVTVVSD
ncbi:MAG TPA: DUF6580 family putative transport protein [Pirellulales bacterium]|jgi:hypothetical protein|nr:DUF6580 family putative transport protein [Pirellulales bacterium]